MSTPPPPDRAALAGPSGAAPGTGAEPGGAAAGDSRGAAGDTTPPGPQHPVAPLGGPAAVEVAAAEHPEPGLLLRLVRRQEVGFALIGGFNTVFGMALTLFWLWFLPDSWPAAISVVFAYAVGTTTAFALHRTLVFRVRGRMLRDFLGFVAVNSGGLLLNVVLLSLAVDVLALPEIPSTVVVMALVAVASFFGHRHISFRRTEVG
ncbi:GtrA family protein [Nocardia sp. NPDC057227]|uniref:GtrA family protein n=1 Tax=Nocardia sp. NPDC057227 TaxID=3346056 RepID=UPI00363464CA